MLPRACPYRPNRARPTAKLAIVTTPMAASLPTMRRRATRPISSAGRHPPQAGAEVEVHAHHRRHRRRRRTRHATARGRWSSCGAAPRTGRRRPHSAPATVATSRPLRKNSNRNGSQNPSTSTPAARPRGRSARTARRDRVLRAGASRRGRRPPASRRGPARRAGRRTSLRAPRGSGRRAARPPRSPAGCRHTSRGRWAAIPLRSWVVSTMASPSPCSSASRCSSSWRVRTSTPEVGSSMTRSWGRRSSARAMKTRCCWPPDRSRMWRPPSPPSPRRSSTSSRLATLLGGRPGCPAAPGPRARHQHRLGHGHREGPVDGLALGDVPDAQAGRAADRSPARRKGAEHGPQQRRLPRSRRTDDADEVAGADDEGGVDDDGGAVVGAGHIVEPDQRPGAGGCPAGGRGAVIAGTRRRRGPWASSGTASSAAASPPSASIIVM